MTMAPRAVLDAPSDASGARGLDGGAARCVPPSRGAQASRAQRRVEPLGRCLLQALPVLIFWLVVVRAGRVVCLVAQRLPPVVLAVRAVRSRAASRRVAREVALAAPADDRPDRVLTPDLSS